MDTVSSSRRRLLRSSAALAVLGSLSGCGTDSDTGTATPTETASSPGRIGTVPGGVTIVAQFSANELVTETDLQSTGDEWFGQPGTIGLSFSDLLDIFEDVYGLRPREFSELIFFGTVETGETGFVGWTTDSVNDVQAVLTDQADTETSYGGMPVYEWESETEGQTRAALLDDGVIAVGAESLVEDSIDVWTDAAEPVSGTVKNEFVESQTGYIRTGFEFTAPVAAAVGSGSGAQVASAFESIRSGHGTLRDTNQGTGLGLEVQTENANAAADLAAILGGMLRSLEQSYDSPDSDELATEILTAVQATNIDIDGATVTVQSDLGIETLFLGHVLSTFFFGFGS